MLKVFDKLLSLGGALDGYKTLIGAGLYLFSALAVQFPALSGGYESTINSLNAFSEALVALGIIHWKVKDLVR